MNGSQPNSEKVSVHTMTTTKKITKREMFEQIKASYPLTEAEVEFIDHELELLSKKNSGEKKPTERQKENADIQQSILQFMEVGKPYTITDLLKSCPACAGLQNQRVSTLVRQLMPDYVTRSEVKGRAYFTKVG